MRLLIDAHALLCERIGVTSSPSLNERPDAAAVP